MEYNYRAIEKKWQKEWRDSGAYKVSNSSDKPKFYVLDMFPYPSGAGLHVGHPLGYIASDIYARFKRLKGYNVLHPMGFDSFGLPAEQYALETGQHPALTTEKNINRYKEQLDNIGFCYDWSREVRTSDPGYYKWTQWFFLQLFDSWYNRKNQKAERIKDLVDIFKAEGNTNSECPGDKKLRFTAEEWNGFDNQRQQEILMDYRLAFSAFGEVNWCEALGTVLANDEVVNGVSERGGHIVVKKKMRQWYLRITEYADRLLQGLEQVDFSDSMKEMQRNWIGKSMGAEISFRLTPGPSPHGEGIRDTSEEMSGHFFKSGNQKFWKTLKEYGRDNRKNATQSEDLLWQNLRNNQLDIKVRRQHAINGFIADFALMEIKLVIEIDGDYHNEQEQQEYDEARTKYLHEFGFDILRFTNTEVLEQTQSVVGTIKKEVQTRRQIKREAAASPLLRKEKGSGDEATLVVYTTRPDTIFGVDFMVIAPEHALVPKITSQEQKPAIDKYLDYVKSRSERERLAEVKSITGAFTGAYAINPFNGRQIPIWISEYVLAGYGTGAIMAVPCGDQRDFAFAKHFDIPITNIIGDAYNGEEANPTKDATLQNSDFLDGKVMRDAIDIAIDKLEEMGIGKRQVNYRMRDAGFSRQRYWGEPFPIVYKGGVAFALDESQLPVELPYVDTYSAGPEGEGPLANLADWIIAPGGGTRETNTMPGYAGSSWYFLRYMDPHNEAVFADRKATDYWSQVDLYIGGTEHAVGHLLYSRLWTKVLFDLGYIGFEEPYKKLVNQGMIGSFIKNIYRLNFNYKIGDGSGMVNVNQFIEEFGVHPEHYKADIPNIFISKEIAGRIDSNSINEKDKRLIDEAIEKAMKIKENIAGTLFFDKYKITGIPVETFLVEDDKLVIESFKVHSRLGNQNSIFVSSCNTFHCGSELGKMSKRYYNVVNPDDIVERFGADTFRMYEMFLGPVEQSKPWDTKGIEGVHRFLRKFWRLFADETKGLIVTNDAATPAELKVLHRTIKKIEEDTERFSFNTAVSAFMVCVNELNDLKCHKKEVLQSLLVLITPYSPHIAEELWKLLGNEGSVLDASFPKFEEKYLVESSKEYPISINGKHRTNINIALDAIQPVVEQIVLSNEVVQKWLDGKAPKKIIFVKGKMINVVI